MEKYLDNKKNLIIAYLILLIIVVYAYSGMFNNYFFSDDFALLEQAINIFHNAYTEYVSQPVLIFSTTIYTTYIINLSIFGVNPIGYQITNLVIHITNILLIGFFISMLFNSKILGFLTCMFWGLSDKYSESVLEIYCRGRTTCLLFYLLTLIFFIKYLKSPSDKKYYYISILTSTLAYVSNWNSIMLLPLLAITLSFFKQEKIFHTLRTNFLSFIPFVVIFLLYSICQLLFKSSHPPSDYYNLDFSFLTNFSGNILNYIGLYYLHLESIVAGIIIIFILFAGIIFSKKQEIRFAIIWIFVTMLPTVLIPFQSPRYQYIPTIGFSLLMAYCVQYFLVHKIYSKFEKFKFVSLSFVILLYFFLCIPDIQKDEQYRDFEGRWCKQIVMEFEKTYDKIPKDTAFFFIEATSPNITDLRVEYFSQDQHNFFNRKQKYLYHRRYGINEQIYFKDLIAFTTFRKGDMKFEFQERQNFSNKKQLDKILLHIGHKFVYKISNIHKLLNDLPEKLYIFYGKITKRKLI